MTQPHLPKYLASTLRLIDLDVVNLVGLGDELRSLWKCLESVLGEILELVSSMRLLIETLEVIHLRKRYLILILLASSFGVNILPQFLHLKRFDPDLFLDHLTILEGPQVGQFWLYFLVH